MKAKGKYKGQTKNKVKSVDMMYLALRRRKKKTSLRNCTIMLTLWRTRALAGPAITLGVRLCPAEFFAPAFSKVYPALRGEIGEAIRMAVGVAMMTTTTTGVII
ncbi:HN1_G0036860.mRNA.1.CDS.1 [Saccharomyces cerevisiae]|nr:HN1_G0036860.mRNA.1.CDS.1 [Saccharomyces cerevisiae]CAI4735021.1 BAL_1a_G0047780.mRNA.1.CDS.1 [Saccharomyces cerevisiae]CAI7325058.1 BAL_1a_G0047780.mRNA.1.CDS.1 [Saccharomyces cerevisiae]